MMSRITIHLKKQFYSPSVAGRHRYDEGAMNLSLSRDRSYSISTTRRNSNASSSSASHVDLGVHFARPQPVHFLSTIWSERSSEMQTHVHGPDPVPVVGGREGIISSQWTGRRRVSRTSLLHGSGKQRSWSRIDTNLRSWLLNVIHYVLEVQAALGG